jgi:hypothetical protein
VAAVAVQVAAMAVVAAIVKMQLRTPEVVVAVQLITAHPAQAVQASLLFRTKARGRLLGLPLVARSHLPITSPLII